MKTVLHLFFVLLLGSTFFVACDGPVEEAKEENEEKFDDTVLEDDAEFAVEFANYFMFTDTLSQLIAERSTDDRLREFATALSSDHQQLKQELQSIASQAKIVLPTTISSDYAEFLEDIRDEDELDEMAEDYLEKVVAMHKTFSKKAEDIMANTETSQFLNFARNVSSQQYVHQNIAEDLLESIES
ncbi:DUF4142 domain-containing protein [Flavilitoribacter nigricans]|uniref:DUF4142 domain-containing protein n=1 Tax=Flavilitoribacter nigricans (strain ATCC 23147 / DSM 23189 / NBRC 102662 / NCIMB 1420 / SS-2) TaxID=1122177 RepID=A0A2D0NJ82_FLAN2|nr:DUF4142 domain-containing protein [Flavilitoribacter nigricans]PHN08450.1 hypothetical protein CRP01_00625 [Flavilitoribacter nigricans DSM 23189 = NBRC 102662]